MSACATIQPLAPSLVVHAFQTALRGAYLPALRQAGKLGELIATQTEALNRDGQYEELLRKSCAGLPSDTLNFQHDPLACAIALGWDGATIEEVPLGLEMRDGLLQETVRPDGKSTRIVTRVDGDAFNRFWLDMVTR